MSSPANSGRNAGADDSAPVPVGIGIGSNLGDREAHLRRAVDFLQTLSQGGALTLSSFLVTAPVDCPPGSGSFLNAVAEIVWIGTPQQLLRRLQTFEQAEGRPVIHPVNGPRPLDLDILYFGNLQIREPDLVIPHPRMLQRLFVLQPLSEIRPRLHLPGQSRTVSELCAKLAGLSD